MPYLTTERELANKVRKLSIVLATGRNLTHQKVIETHTCLFSDKPGSKYRILKTMLKYRCNDMNKPDSHPFRCCFDFDDQNNVSVWIYKFDFLIFQCRYHHNDAQTAVDMITEQCGEANDSFANNEKYDFSFFIYKDDLPY